MSRIVTVILIYRRHKPIDLGKWDASCCATTISNKVHVHIVVLDGIISYLLL
jgi:hypothetical protein